MPRSDQDGASNDRIVLRYEELGWSPVPPSSAPLIAADSTSGPGADGESLSGLVTCSICLSSISTEDEQTTCPGCGQPFHVECWQENLGCAVYGCTQVNALRTGPDIKIAFDAPSLPILPALGPQWRNIDGEVYTEAELCKLLRLGQLSGSMLCSPADTSQWRPASEWPTLAENYSAGNCEASSIKTFDGISVGLLACGFVSLVTSVFAVSAGHWLGLISLAYAVCVCLAGLDVWGDNTKRQRPTLSNQQISMRPLSLLMARHPFATVFAVGTVWIGFGLLGDGTFAAWAVNFGVVSAIMSATIAGILLVDSSIQRNGGKTPRRGSPTARRNSPDWMKFAVTSLAVVGFASCGLSIYAIVIAYQCKALSLLSIGVMLASAGICMFSAGICMFFAGDPSQYPELSTEPGGATTAVDRSLLYRICRVIGSYPWRSIVLIGIAWVSGTIAQGDPAGAQYTCALWMFFCGCAMVFYGLVFGLLSYREPTTGDRSQAPSPASETTKPQNGAKKQPLGWNLFWGMLAWWLLYRAGIISKPPPFPPSRHVPPQPQQTKPPFTSRPNPYSTRPTFDGWSKTRLPADPPRRTDNASDDTRQ